VKTAVISRAIIAALPMFVFFAQNPAKAQIIPQPWVSVGVQDSDVTYAIGAKAFGLGVELGTGRNGATGVDVLKFINLPVVSPYVGIGLYSNDEGLSYSGGVQVGGSGNIFFGAGYNSVRGVNGQVGLKF
jgi:hypothetical protein